MKFNLNDFRKDDELATDGVWVEFGGGAAFKIASLDNPTFTEAFRKKVKPYNDLKREIPDEDQESIMVDCMAQHIVLDWRNVFDGDDELEYSVDAAKRILSELDKVREMVLAESQKVSNFRQEAAKEIEGN